MDTTIMVKSETLQKLRDLKIHPRSTHDEVISELLKLKEEQQK